MASCKQAVCLWALAWIRGEVPEAAVQLWTRGSVKLFGKKDGEGVRPITLFETVLKLATGLAWTFRKRTSSKPLVSSKMELL